MEKLVKNKGITLVALVITIIILLILAGISIQAISTTGLFANAKIAKEKSIKAEMEETVKTKLQELEIEKMGEATLNDITENWIVSSKLKEKYNAIIIDGVENKKIRMKKDNVTLTCLIDTYMNVKILKAVGLTYTVDKTTLDGNNIKAKIVIINDENGLEKIEMPDGTQIECRGEKEIEIEYVVKIGKEYLIKVTSKDNTISEEKLLINSIPCNISADLSTGTQMENKAITVELGKEYNNKITSIDDYVITGITATMEGGKINVDNETGEITADKVTGDITIQVTSKKMEISITEKIINTSKNFEGSSNNEATIESGDNAYIKIKAISNVTGATITISPDVPYLVTKNGKYNFTITATYNGKKIDKKEEVVVNQFKSALDVVKYDAGNWTKEEIELLKENSLYNINIAKTAPSSLNFTFGGFTYEGDKDNSNYIENGTIITSRNKSVSGQNGYGTPKYNGWQILTSEERNGKTYVTKLVHAGSPENFAFYNTTSYSSREGEYVLSSGTRWIGSTSCKPRDWNMYKDKTLDAKGFINEVHIMTYKEAFEITGSDGKTSGIRNINAYYYLASSYSGRGSLWSVTSQGDEYYGNNYAWRYKTSNNNESRSLYCKWGRNRRKSIYIGNG